MAEIVGVAATAAQLAETVFSLLGLINKIKSGSSTLKRYNQQLQELRSLSDSVSKNPLLQTAEVGLQTQTILSIIEDNYLASLLQKNRWIRTWELLYHERDINDVFSLLERQKASLSLVIEDIQSRALHQIQTDIKVMAHNNPNFSPDSQGRPTDYPSDAMAPGSSTPSESTDRKIAVQRQDQTDYPTLANFDPAMVSMCASIFQSLMTNNSATDAHRSSQKAPLGLHWKDCSAGANVEQMNGDIIELRNGTSGVKEKQDLPDMGCERLYENCTKTGPGSQHNRHVIMDHGGNYNPTIKYSTTWERCTNEGSPSDSNGSKKKDFQYQGVKFIQVIDKKEKKKGTRKGRQPQDSTDEDSQHNGKNVSL